jgi:cell division protein FtsW
VIGHTGFILSRQVCFGNLNFAVKRENMEVMPKLKQTIHTPDLPLLTTIILLLLFGIVMVYDASVVVSHDVFGGKYHFLFLQFTWVFFGALAALFVYHLGYNRLAKFGFLLLLISLLLLFLVAWPNIPVLNKLLVIPEGFYNRFFPEIYGARRWIIVPGRISFQPSELAKFSSILYFSRYLAAKNTGAPQGRRRFSTWFAKDRRSLGPFLFLLILLAVLILLEPDYGTAAILVAIVLSIFFASGVRLAHILSLTLLIVVLGGALVITSPYRLRRFETYLNPSAADPLESGYHIKQVMIALGSGGFLGLGFGQSRQKYDYLPEVATDSIFAVVGEELGFVGASLLVALFMFLIYRSFLVAIFSTTMLGRLVAVGVASWLAVQIAVNLAAMTALVPLTGIPLPLVSYGGSSMLFVMMALGLLLSVSKETARETE